MKIGIIGAGNIGATLARRLVASGHDVKISNSKGPETIRDIARQTGAKAVSKEAAARDVEIIILSVPFAKYPDVAPLFKSVPEATIVIDTPTITRFATARSPKSTMGNPKAFGSASRSAVPSSKHGTLYLP